ncbi:hypothetical protein C8T65DRAFT_699689 [Cerioporus squamosus]|nr:hypothetical protein C8T65DRAFT_699689 [Cerioporus squamosus]
MPERWYTPLPSLYSSSPALGAFPEWPPIVLVTSSESVGRHCSSIINQASDALSDSDRVDISSDHTLAVLARHSALESCQPEPALYVVYDRVRKNRVSSSFWRKEISAGSERLDLRGQRGSTCQMSLTIQDAVVEKGVSTEPQRRRPCCRTCRQPMRGHSKATCTATPTTRNPGVPDDSDSLSKIGTHLEATGAWPHGRGRQNTVDEDMVTQADVGPDIGGGTGWLQLSSLAAVGAITTWASLAYT